MRIPSSHIMVLREYTIISQKEEVFEKLTIKQA